MNQLATTIPTNNIYTVRNQKVMLDRDVAASLGEDVKVLNQNAARSPKWEYLRSNGIEIEYRFQLTPEEVKILRSQIVTMSDSKYLPWVYTRKGCAYFGTSMNNQAACLQAVQLVEVFDKVRTVIEDTARLDRDYNMRKQALILESVKVLLAIPNYNTTAVAKYVEQGICDLNGIAVQERTMLDVMSFLQEKGLSASQARKKCITFGKVLKSVYLKSRGVIPKKGQRFIDGTQRLVNSYTEKDRALFEKSWDIFNESEALELTEQ